MSKKILIAFCTTYGATEETAFRMGTVLKNICAGVHVKNIADIKDISDYDAIIIGSPTRIGKLLPQVLNFARTFRDQLETMKTAYFTMGVTMKKDTPENREKAKQALQPLIDIKTPVSTGLFAGKVDYKKIGFIWRIFNRVEKSGALDQGDFRDWTAIENWTEDAGRKLCS